MASLIPDFEYDIFITRIQKKLLPGKRIINLQLRV